MESQGCSVVQSARKAYLFIDSNAIFGKLSFHIYFLALSISQTIGFESVVSLYSPEAQRPISSTLPYSKGQSSFLKLIIIQLSQAIERCRLVKYYASMKSKIHEMNQFIKNSVFMIECEIKFKTSKIALKINNKIAMQANKIQEGQIKKRSYSKIPIKKRMMLIKLVLKRGVSLSQAIQKLGLKITTARFIINKYQETGTFPHRKFKRRTGKKAKINPCKEEFVSDQEEEEESFGEKDKEKVKIEEMALQGKVKTEEDGKMLLVYYPWLMI